MMVTSDNHVRLSRSASKLLMFEEELAELEDKVIEPDLKDWRESSSSCSTLRVEVNVGVLLTAVSV